jgi:hypothetical protein
MIGSVVNNTVAFPKNLVNLRLKADLSGVPVTESGTYHVALHIKDVGESDHIEVKRIPFDVQLVIEKSS